MQSVGRPLKHSWDLPEEEIVPVDSVFSHAQEFQPALQTTCSMDLGLVYPVTTSV